MEKLVMMLLVTSYLNRLLLEKVIIRFIQYAKANLLISDIA